MPQNNYLGFPLACWPANPDGTPEPPIPFSPYDSGWRRFAAQILCAQYVDGPRAELELGIFLGPTYTVVRVDNSPSLVPGTIIASDGLHLLVFVSGTSNDQQFVTQAFQALSPPTIFGTYATFPQWNAAAIAIANRIVAAGFGGEPLVVFVGHSYGAAVSQILAYLAAVADEDRIVFLLTFGCPPAGRFPAKGPPPVNLVEASLLNDGDPIGFFPPPEPFLTFAFPFIGPDTYVFWSQWKPPRGLLRLGFDGVSRYDDSSVVTWDVLLVFILDAVGGFPIPPVADHLMPEYVRRLFLPNVATPPCGFP